MKPSLAVLLSALLAAGVAACGGGGPTRPRLVPAAPSRATGESAAAVYEKATASFFARAADGYVKGDDDQDQSLKDDRTVRLWGRDAGGLARELTPLVKHYLAAALSGDGAKTCAMLAAGVTGHADLRPLVPRAYRSPATQALHAAPCPAFMSHLLALSHGQLQLAEAATLKVRAVRLDARGATGLVIMSFKNSPERYLTVKREHGAWKLGDLLDQELP